MLKFLKFSWMKLHSSRFRARLFSFLVAVFFILSVVSPIACASASPPLYHTTRGFKTTVNFNDASFDLLAKPVTSTDDPNVQAGPSTPYISYPILSSPSTVPTLYNPNTNWSSSSSTRKMAFLMNFVSSDFVPLDTYGSSAIRAAHLVDSFYSVTFTRGTSSISSPGLYISTPSVPSGNTSAAVFISPLNFYDLIPVAYPDEYTSTVKWIIDLLTTGTDRPLFGVPYIPRYFVEIYDSSNLRDPIDTLTLDRDTPLTYAFDPLEHPSLTIKYCFTSDIGLGSSPLSSVDPSVSVVYPALFDHPLNGSSLVINNAVGIKIRHQFAAVFEGSLSSYVGSQVPVSPTDGELDQNIVASLVFTPGTEIPGLPEDPDPDPGPCDSSFDLEAFFSRFSQWISDSFIPTSFELNSSISYIQSAFQIKFGIFYQAVDLTYIFFSNLLTSMDSIEDYVFEWPALTMDLFGDTYTIVPSYSYDANEGLVPLVRPYLGTVVIILCALSLIRTLQRYWEVLIDDHFFLDFTG